MAAIIWKDKLVCEIAVFRMQIWNGLFYEVDSIIPNDQPFALPEETF